MTTEGFHPLDVEAEKEAMRRGAQSKNPALAQQCRDALAFLELGIPTSVVDEHGRDES